MLLTLCMLQTMALAAGASAPDEWMTGSSSGTGTLTVTSNMSGADVYIDGALYEPAITPCTISLAPGIYAAEVHLPGYNSVQKSVQITDGENTDFYAELHASVPSGPGVRILTVGNGEDPYGTMADYIGRNIDYASYENYILDDSSRGDSSHADWIYRSADYTLSLRMALCIVMNDTGWYDEANHVRWHYVIRFADSVDSVMLRQKILLWGRGSGELNTNNLPGNPDDVYLKPSNDGGFTIDGDKDGDGRPDITLYGTEYASYDSCIILSCSDAHFNGLIFSDTMHVAVGDCFNGPKVYHDLENISITGCRFIGKQRFFLNFSGEQGTAASGFGQPGAYDLDGYTFVGNAFDNSQLGIIVANGDGDYCSLNHLSIKANTLYNSGLFVATTDAHSWYLWGQDSEYSGETVGVSSYNSLTNVDISGNVSTFDINELPVSDNYSDFSRILNLFNADLGHSDNTMSNVILRCNKSRIEQAVVDSYDFWPRASVTVYNAAVGDNQDYYDVEAVAAQSETSRNVMHDIRIAYNDYESLVFYCTNLPYFSGKQTGIENDMYNIEIEHNRICTLKGVELKNASGEAEGDKEWDVVTAEGEMRNVSFRYNDVSLLAQSDTLANPFDISEHAGINIFGVEAVDWDEGWGDAETEPINVSSKMQNVTVSDNSISGFPVGIRAAGANCGPGRHVNGSGIDDLTITGNTITTLLPKQEGSMLNYGILLTASVRGGQNNYLKNVTVSGNTVYAANGVTAAGLWSSNPIYASAVSGNCIDGLTIADNVLVHRAGRTSGGYPLLVVGALDLPLALMGFEPPRLPEGCRVTGLTAENNSTSGFPVASMVLPSEPLPVGTEAVIPDTPDYIWSPCGETPDPDVPGEYLLKGEYIGENVIDHPWRNVFITITIAEPDADICIIGAGMTDGTTHFRVYNRTERTTAIAAVAYYLNERLVHIDLDELALSDGYSHAMYAGEFDHCCVFLLGSSYEPLSCSTVLQ